MYANRSEKEQREATDAKIAALRQQLADEEEAQRQHEAAEQRRLAGIQKDCGASHTRVVLDLYDLLDIDPEHPRTRVKVKGVDEQIVEVSTDKAEKLRSQRLYDVVEQLVRLVPDDALQAVLDADAAAREDRHRQRLK